MRPSPPAAGTLRLLLVGLLMAGVLVPAAAGAPPGRATDGPAIVAVHPNPVADGDRGEFVVVHLPAPGNWSLADGESVVRLPPNASGTVAVSTAPGAARELTDQPVLALSGRLHLANGGERIALRRAGTTVATVVYPEAPTGEVYRPSGGGWRPVGATDRPVVTSGGGRARAFVLPDAPAPPVDALRAADRRILLAGYTFTSGRVAEALLAAAARNVTVRVLVEGEPVGGTTRRQARVLDRLAAADIRVRVLGGRAPRYAFHHPKYAVVDDRAIVLTENWKPAGVGGRSSRGWGVVLDDPGAARALAETFRADAGARDAREWAAFRRGRSFEAASRANGSFDGRFEVREVPVRRTRVLVAPDNAEAGLVSLLDGADESVRVVQPTVGGPSQPLVRAARRAAERGVRVRLLLSSAWYVREDNRRLAEYLNERADAGGLPLTVRLADPRGRFEKIHAKGIVVDGEAVALGSLNWNDHSTRENREVVVVMEGEAVAGYYARVFDADWQGRDGARRLPVGLAGALVVAGVGALALARRIRFA